VARRRDYKAEYAARKRRAQQRGLSTSAARGHAKRGETTATEYRQVEKGTASRRTLEKVAFNAAKEKLADRPHIRRGREEKPIFNPELVRERIRTTDDETLRMMIEITAEQWATLASAQYPNNSFFYGGFRQDQPVAA